ncbi:hypothetical protein HY312_04010 [Candidatus Saccharibacteria bacterium]|nr:hypothetical protein [Candidatus Saccharibacteria bacterium]
MEKPQFSDSGFEQRNTKAIELFVDGSLLINGDDFDDELAHIGEIGTELPQEQDAFLEGDVFTEASDVLVTYGFRRPIDINIGWRHSAEETYQKDGFIETNPHEEVFSLKLSYDGASVDFFVTVTDGSSEVVLEKEISIRDENFDLDSVREKYNGIFSSNSELNESLVETLLENKIYHNNANEILDVTDTEIAALILLSTAKGMYTTV